MKKTFQIETIKTSPEHVSTSPEHNTAFLKGKDSTLFESIMRAFLYYARVIDNMLLTALNHISTTQTKQ